MGRPNTVGASRRVAALLLAAGVLLGMPAIAAASDYCVPENTQYNPPDVPPEGSRLETPPGVTRGTLEYNGLKTPLLTSGPQNTDEAVVFLHGSPGSSQDWSDLLPRVGAMGRRAVAFDLIGFGHADKPWESKNDLAEGTRLLGDALTALGIKRVHFVVHDVGGAPALQWSAENPDSLLSIALMPAGLLGYRHQGLAAIARMPEAGEAFFAGLNRQVFTAPPQNPEQRRLPESFSNRLYDDFDRETRCAILRIYRSADEEQIQGFARAQADVLKKRARPALVSWGRNDEYLPVDMAERQREAFPGAAVHIFEDSGHWPFIDNPDRTRDLFLPFIRCVPTGKRDRIRISLRPRAVSPGVATKVQIRTTVRRDGRSRPVCGARVAVAGRHLKSGDTGSAETTIATTRSRAVHAKKAGLLRGAASLRVRRR